MVLIGRFQREGNPLVPGGVLGGSHGEEHVVHSLLLAWCKLLPAVVPVSFPAL